jgi:hypothetical protein
MSLLARICATQVNTRGVFLSWLDKLDDFWEAVTQLCCAAIWEEEEEERHFLTMMIMHLFSLVYKSS